MSTYLVSPTSGQTVHWSLIKENKFQSSSSLTLFEIPQTFVNIMKNSINFPERSTTEINYLPLEIL